MKTERTLGLSGFDRGFAVSVLDDGVISFAVEEEKLRRWRGLGFEGLQAGRSLALELAISGVERGIEAIDTVVYVPPIAATTEQTQEQALRLSAFLERHYGVAPEVRTIDHVAAHLAFERAVHSNPDHVLMVGHDRAVCSSRGRDEPDFDIRFSAVSFLERLARFVGMDGGRIHHLENMARFGEPRFVDQLNEMLERDSDPERWTALEKLAGSPRRLPGAKLESVHFDFAASLHGVLRLRVQELVRRLPSADSGPLIALCGGVFQSWSLNDALAEAFPERRFLVSFAPGNPGCAIGGPLAARGDDLPVQAPRPFLGPGYTRQEVKSVLDNSKARYEFRPSDQILESVCGALEDGKMVGWFSGRCEFGNRALGSRSVFANPASPYSCDNLSSYLKLRPSYFAYAVAIPDERPEVAGVESPYLSRSIHLPEYFEDASVRVQTVSRARTPVLHELIERFRHHTGVPALLNTSLNYFDEPIACTPRDALKTFYASGLDMLVMENFLLSKS